MMLTYMLRNDTNDPMPPFMDHKKYQYIFKRKLSSSNGNNSNINMNNNTLYHTTGG